MILLLPRMQNISIPHMSIWQRIKDIMKNDLRLRMLPRTLLTLLVMNWSIKNFFRTDEDNEIVVSQSDEFIENGQYYKAFLPLGAVYFSFMCSYALFTTGLRVLN